MQKAFFVAFLVCISIWSCSGESEKERELFRKIEPGMEASKVYEILGKPDTIIHHFDSLSTDAYFFTKNKSAMRASMPVVVFDSLMRVSFSTYDGE
ncbi:MAG TPA: outer membrane protein assembly factor BamE [Ferruginibacter sp.]|nr:outer membrane protein assembly factor BamE [Ferruginibacter sp.]